MRRNAALTFAEAQRVIGGASDRNHSVVKARAFSFVGTDEVSERGTHSVIRREGKRRFQVYVHIFALVCQRLLLSESPHGYCLRPSYDAF